jgi:N6-adenosine-specific RNA methylase IME4
MNTQPEKRYRTIVADPPWRQAGSYAVTRGFTCRIPDKRDTPLPYPSMTVGAIAALPVRDLAARDAHLYLWTTQQYLHDSFHIIDAWGFRKPVTLVWCKEPLSVQLGGTFGSSVEFVHFARRGSLPALDTVDRRWFTWPRRRGAPVKMGERRIDGHSAKPEAFLDMVERVSPGPYLELFARRQRLGWDTWGNEALNHVEIAS